MDNKHRCHNCMSEIGVDNKCPNCNYINGSSEHNSSYLIPDTILNDRYIVGNLLRFNKESAVYIAYDTEIETVVEVKEYMPSDLAKRDPDSLKILLKSEDIDLYKELAKEFLNLNEGLSKIRTISSLVQIYEIFPQNNTCYAVMEHVNGTNLNDYLLDNLGEISWESASELFMPVIDHMEKLHEMGFIHGGLSPETIFITDKGKVKLGGILIPSMCQLGGKISAELYGGYAAPEQYNPDQELGPWTDVYGICAVLYKALTGTKPSDAKTRASVDNLLPPTSLNHSVPNHISVAILSSMTLSPRLRTQTMHDLYTDLTTEPRQQFKDEDIPAEEEQKSSRRYIFIAMGITAAVLVLISGIILYFMYGGNSEGEEDSAQLSLPSANITSMLDSSLQVNQDDSSEQSSAAETLLMYNLIGKDINVVQTHSYYSSFTVTVEGEEYNEDYAEGQIIYQSIEENKEISAGQAVSVKVSKGSAYRTVPDYSGKNIDQYDQALQDAGITNYEKVTVFDIFQQDGTVMYTSVEPGDKIHVETTLTVSVVSNP